MMGVKKNFGYSCPGLIFYVLTKEASEKNNSLASKRKFLGERNWQNE